MRTPEEQRTTYYQSRRKALANATTIEQAELVRLQTEAVCLATGWTEFQSLADEALNTQSGLQHGTTSLVEESRSADASWSDVHHE